MSNLVRVLHNDACQQARQQLCTILNSVIHCEGAVYAYDVNAHVTSEAFTFLRNIRVDDPLVNVYLNMVKEACYKSELEVGFGTKLICMHIVYLINCMQYKNLLDMHNSIKLMLHAFTSAIVDEGITPNRVQFEAAIEDAVNDIDVQHNVIRALDEAGLNGSVYISNDLAANDSISTVDGYVFNIISHMHRYNEPAIQLYKCKSLLVDGIIEQVSEVHQLLERFSKENEPLVIFALGFGDEVLHTLETNLKRGTLRVYPVRIPSEIDCINLLNDLQVVTGTRFISSMQGEIIQMADYDSLKPVDFLSLSHGKITIKNDSTTNNVAAHVAELRRRAASTETHDINQLLFKRIRALTSQYVNVRLAARSQQEHLQKHEKMSQALRYATSIINSGVLENARDTNRQDLLVALNDLPHQYLSINAVLFATTMAVSTFEMLSSIDAACILD